jgi:hypothetical protein
MSRFIIALLATMAAGGTAQSADRALLRHGWHRTAVLLPAGLPRPHYNFRTTISYDAPYPYHRGYAHPVYAYEAPVLFTPVHDEVPYITPVIGIPLLPGYYGTAYPYDYQVGYWDRLPYACGVYGYC